MRMGHEEFFYRMEIWDHGDPCVDINKRGKNPQAECFQFGGLFLGRSKG